MSGAATPVEWAFTEDLSRAANSNFAADTIETVSRDFPDVWSAAIQVTSGDENEAWHLLRKTQSNRRPSFIEGLRAGSLNQPAVYTVLLAPLRGGIENCAYQLM